MSEALFVNFGPRVQVPDGFEIATLAPTLRRRAHLFISLVVSWVPGILVVTRFTDPDVKLNNVHHPDNRRGLDVAHFRETMRLPSTRTAYRRARDVTNLFLPYGRGLDSVVFDKLTGTPSRRAKNPGRDWTHLLHAHVQGPSKGV